MSVEAALSSFRLLDEMVASRLQEGPGFPVLEDGLLAGPCQQSNATVSTPEFPGRSDFNDLIYFEVGPRDRVPLYVRVSAFVFAYASVCVFQLG